MKPPPEKGLPPATPIGGGRKKMSKLATGKRDDTPLHTASRAGNIGAVMEILSECYDEDELISWLSRRNYAGETPLYVAAEYGHVDLVRLLIDQCDVATASIKANNGFDALHIAAKLGDLEILKVLMDAHPELSMTVDMSNTTALHTAAMQGNTDVVNYLLEIESSLASIARSNGKTALHSSARNGHLQVVKAFLEKAPGISARIDKKGQTALHMAAKGLNHEVVEELIKADPSLLNVVDAKGNTALHIATRKGRVQIVNMLLACNEINTQVVNRSNETAVDTAQKMGNPEVGRILQEHGVPSAQTLNPPSTPARELKQTVSDIKNEVHHQLEHTRQTRRRVQGIAKHLNKMQAEGLNNAINSTTVVAVLIATVAFAGIFTVPGQYVDDVNDIPEGYSLGEANIAPQPSFIIFFVFDSVALFISLAVVVVQTSVVVIESKAKKQMMAIINKLMWLACVLVSVAFLALAFIVVGEHEKWLAICVTVIGTSIMVSTLGLMCYWVIMHRIETSNMRNLRRSGSKSRSRSKSWSLAVFSDTDAMNSEFKKMYAI